MVTNRTRNRAYPPRSTVSGDCPICNKYQSMTVISWRGLAFCSHKHLRMYMHETLLEESADIFSEVLQEMDNK